MSIRVGVLGAGGRMGSTVCRAVAGDPECELVAAVDPYHSGIDLRVVTGVDQDFASYGDRSVFTDAGVQVAVDFTEAGPARDNLLWLAEHGIHAVVGTTGFSDTDLAEFEAAFTTSNCAIVPNFAIGAVLMTRFAAMAAPYFDTAEIIEFHHDQKVDAPSGTALHTAHKMLEASADWADDPTSSEVVNGARAGDVGGIRVHSVRMRGMVAHQSVLLGTTGQTLEIRHDSYDRTSFMPGVLLAVKGIPHRPGLTVGLEPFLEA